MNQSTNQPVNQSTGNRSRWYTIWDDELALEIRERAGGIEARLPGDSGGGESFSARSLAEAYSRAWARLQGENIEPLNTPSP